MKRICSTFCLVLSTTISIWVQGYDVSVSVFRRASTTLINDSAGTEILATEAFRTKYNEKANAEVEYLAWSPDMRYIAVVVSNVYTGDYDDIWIISTLDKSFSCLSCVLPTKGVGIPIWKSRDTVMFRVSNHNIVIDVPTASKVSEPGIDWKSEPSISSPDGEFRYQFDSGGLRIFRRDGKQVTSVGEGKTAGGSILGMAYSSDSRFLAVEQFMGHGAARIMIADFQSESLNILKLPFSLFQSKKGRSNWQPGKSILSVADDDGILHCLDVFSYKQTAFGFSEYYILGAAWSPDCKLVAMVLQKKQGGARSIRIVESPGVD